MSEVRASSKWSDAEEAVRTRLRKYRAIVVQRNACQALHDSLYPRTTAKMRDNIGGRSQIEMFEIEAVVEKRMELSDMMTRLLGSMREECDSVMQLIKGLPPDEGTVLMRRYTLAESWEEIGKAMNYCESHVRRKHDRAITRLGEEHEQL